jgi:hypothetical protein
MSAIASFTVSQAVTVYSAWDDRAWTPGFDKPGAAPKTGWMDPYVFSGYNLFISCSGAANSHSMWQANYPAGTVTVGSGWDVPEMYSIIVTPQAAVATEAPQVNASIATLRALPNPFNQITSLQFSVPGKQYLTLNVYDLAGRRVASLLNQEMKQGIYQVSWTGAGMHSGVYIARLQIKTRVLTQKLLLVK